MFHVLIDIHMFKFRSTAQLWKLFNHEKFPIYTIVPCPDTVAINNS